MSDTAWLIERKYNSVTHYFSGYVDTYEVMAAFRSDADAALRFARSEDAALFLKRFLSGIGSVHEHAWVDLPKEAATDE